MLCLSWPPPPLFVPPKWPQNFFYQTFLKTVEYMVHCLRIVAMTLLVAPPWHVLRTGQSVNGVLSVQYCTDSIALSYVKNTSQNHELCLSNRQIFLNLFKRACCNQLKCWYIVCRPVSTALVDIESPILHGTLRCPLYCVGWNNRHNTAHTTSGLVKLGHSLCLHAVPQRAYRFNELPDCFQAN